MPGPGVPTVYVLVREDLPLPHQMAQALHAIALAAEEFEGVAAAHVVALAVADEVALRRAAADIEDDFGLDCALWCEPDLGGAATAMATVPTALRGPFRGFRLWGP